MFLRCSLVLVCLATCGSVRAADVQIEMFDAAFLPQIVTINAGDTVTWTWVGGQHLLTSGLPNGAPGTPDEPGLLFEAPINQTQTSFSYTFPQFQPLGFTFFDANNPTQVGFIQMNSDEQTFVVTVLDNVFEPEDVYLFQGDTVRWEHEPGRMLHTITSGASSQPQDNPGALFDAISSDAHPVFEFQFTMPGPQPYFCIPHEAMGMGGTIHVQSRFLRGDTNRDGSLNLSDAIVLLGYLFENTPTECLDAFDANDDGTNNLADAILLLGHLFSGVALPAPFPAEGPDRTADNLYCFP